jgi:hypothetical protein
MEWSTHVLPCPTGEKVQQLQSAYPLDERGDLILVGRSPNCSGAEDYQVFDLSSGEPVMLDAIAVGQPGFNLAAHSPRGSRIGFGAEGTRLVVYEPPGHQGAPGGFSLVAIPCDGNCTATSVWAHSPDDVWIATGPPGNVGRIVRYHRGEFTTEYEGARLNDLWGFGGNPAGLFAVGDRILQRQQDGTWVEVVDPDEVAAACGLPYPLFGTPLQSVHGSGPEDVWAAGIGGDDQAACLFHGDGKQWAAIAPPAGADWLHAVWSIARRQVLVAGQGAVDLTRGLVALWGSTDGGASWTQISDEAFIDLPTAGDAGFFNLAATTGGTRIYAPAINGTLLRGSVNHPGFWGHPAGSSHGVGAGAGQRPTP